MSEEQTAEAGSTQEDQPVEIYSEGELIQDTEKPEEEPTEPVEASEEDGSVTEEEPVKKKNRVDAKTRITHLTSRALSAEHKVKQLEEQLKKANENAGQRPIMPDLESFTDEYGEVDKKAYSEAIQNYEDKVYDWRESQKMQSNSERQAQIDHDAKVEAFKEASEITAAKYPDYYEMINKEVFSSTLQAALLESQDTELAYYLGKNENIAKKISGMNPNEMQRELGRLEIKISGLGKQPSNAPDPISPVGSSEGAHKKDPSKMTDEEWFKHMKAQEIEKIKSRGY